MPLAAPLYLRLTTPPFDGAYVCLREHRPPRAARPAAGPLLLLTFHPGFITGSYGDWDYFERLSSSLFGHIGQHYRLRAFTVNHPGYDYPPNAPVDRYRLEPYSIRNQPQAMKTAVAWLLDGPLADESDVIWIAYGHSMGGLALGQCETEALVAQMAAAGRRLRLARVLSAPAFCIHAEARATLGQLDALHVMKLTLGRLPLYAPVATGLFRSFAPLFYRAGADRFSIRGLSGFRGFRRLNPFVLLEQGRELLRLEASTICGPDTLANAHVILARQDGMIDLPALRELLNFTQTAGHDVACHEIDSTHLLELDAPNEVAGIVREIIEQIAAGAE